MNEKTLELLHNKDFVKKILSLSPEDAQKEIEKEGGAISVDELKQIGETINNAIRSNGELDEESLEQVAGGGKRLEVVCFAVGVAVGVALIVSW